MVNDTERIYLAGSWLILQVFDVALIQIGLPQWIMALAVWLIFFGFPVALLMSWRYEFTSEGIRRTAPAAAVRGTNLSIRLVDYLLMLAILVFLVLLSVTLVQMLRGDATCSAEHDVSPNSIAVLPFENMSGQQENEYFGRGLAEDILHRLAMISELRVASRTASFELDTSDMDMAMIGRRLGVTSLAARLTESLLEADPEDAELLTNLAHYSARLGEDLQASRYIRLALEASPDDVYAHYYASLVHLEAGRLEQSMQEIIRSVELGYPVVLLRSDPQFKRQENDPEFVALVREDDSYD